jgi:hypothetical protein
MYNYAVDITLEDLAFRMAPGVQWRGIKWSGRLRVNEVRDLHCLEFVCEKTADKKKSIAP